MKSISTTELRTTIPANAIIPIITGFPGSFITAFFTGTVNTVTFENNTPFLISGGQKIALGDVIQVAAPRIE